MKDKDIGSLFPPNRGHSLRVYSQLTEGGPIFDITEGFSGRRVLRGGLKKGGILYAADGSVQQFNGKKLVTLVQPQGRISIGDFFPPTGCVRKKTAPVCD